MKIRFATIKDAPELLKIYEQYIDTPITFEEKIPSLYEYEPVSYTHLIDDKYIYIANVGDSRAYYMDDKGLHQITTDHTFVNLLLMQGKIEPEEVHTHPKRNMLTKAVGVERVVVPDFFRMKREDKFTVLLCSDGLSGYCSDNEIYDIMSKTPFEELPKALIDLALSKGGRDNITLAVISD